MAIGKTNIYLRKLQKAAFGKIAEEKGISVAELVRPVLDMDPD